MVNTWNTPTKTQAKTDAQNVGYRATGQGYAAYRRGWNDTSSKFTTQTYMSRHKKKLNYFNS